MRLLRHAQRELNKVPTRTRSFMVAAASAANAYNSPASGGGGGTPGSATGLSAVSTHLLQGGQSPLSAAVASSLRAAGSDYMASGPSANVGPAAGFNQDGPFVPPSVDTWLPGMNPWSNPNTPGDSPKSVISVTQNPNLDTLFDSPVTGSGPALATAPFGVSGSSATSSC